MKKFIYIVIIFHSVLFGVTAQKKTIDNSSYKSWDQLSSYNLSSNGKYAWFKNWSLSSSRILNVIFLTDFQKIIFPDIEGDPIWVSDNSYLIFKAKMALNIFNLETKKNQCIADVKDFKVSKDGHWIAYNCQGQLTLKNLSSNYEKKYIGVEESLLNDQGTTLLLQKKGILIWVSLNDMSEKIIAEDSTYNKLKFDKAGTKIAYLTGSNELILKYFESEMSEVQSLIAPTTSNLRNNFEISDEPIWFSNNSENIFFKLKKKEAQNQILANDTLSSSKVNIWYYKDEYLHSERQYEELNSNRSSYTAAFAIKQKNLVHLENDKQILIASPGKHYALVRTKVQEQELYWNNALISYELISITDGVKQPIIQVPNKLIDIAISPTEKFVLWYDPNKDSYFSYEIGTGVTRDISSQIIEPLFVDSDRADPTSVGVAGWLYEDSSVLVYDRHDIWELDPLSYSLPTNITNSLGKKNNLAYRIAVMADEMPHNRSDDSLLLVGLNLSTKENGFWKLSSKKHSSPVMCSMSSSIYYFPSFFVGAPHVRPMKAKNANIFLLTRCSVDQAPNLFITSDFRNFNQISDIAPQKDYNWMTSELIRWKMLDGKIGEGILYKPENFDSTRKYPIIFHYYERKSNELNQFHMPSLSTGGLNIPWYVSNGYLVFLPDIKPSKGSIGDDAANSVISAGQYFAKKNWIDSTGMGLQGHSYGGYETNYIITKTSLFSAAQSSAGLSDLVSEFGGLGFGDKSLTFMTEVGQMNLGKAPWEDPLVYIKNSPIFYSNHVSTPLLIMHNKNDGAVPFSQSLEFFVSLRRQKIPVWLLQYDGEGHILSNSINKLDFSIRQQQFFDHFLKHTQIPKWLKEIAPIRKK
ncbi:S9 family peptidase [Chitinophaga sp. S165]|uniref:alpha/beta hydrolase family protein n=1 Tax=Chitinophaga sp. S165 TaxID=2135462 RepID=UPI000D711962|nr:prolyl oligopeptidase family serine peptidase [Chitinophaga sp. S165]PWV48111.1 dipeptidyl aminopeptidase/acylaminoacyl peptidase [Chitinophaga sp. S165]